MRVIKNHEQHIRDVQNSITRERGRLDYLKRCEAGQETWRESKKQLQREIDRQSGKLQAYEDCLEMAEAFQQFDNRGENEKAD